MRSRRGFTLVELMVVILIVAILVALLVPAIMSAVVTANNARVAAEENNLATALADFKTRFGEFPPSRIILYNLTAGTTPAPYVANATSLGAGDQTVGDLNQRTARAMKKYWPRAGAFFPTSGVASVSITWPGSSANGFTILQGDECLVFFLGGMPLRLGNGDPAVVGFNRDPQNPFTVPNLATDVSVNRSTPIYEFSPSRLVDLDGDGFFSYIDPLSANSSAADLRPYAYFSAYGNNGYDPNDVNFSETDDAGNAISRSFLVNFATAGGTRFATSASPNPYTVGDAAAANQGSAVFINSATYQIISSGRDGRWGPGGTYDARATDNKLSVGFPNDPSNAALARKYERDNITNFAAGRID